MFQFRRFPAYAYFVQRRLTEYCSAGLPHSEIHGSRDICSSPWLIAACHVLRRLLMPRHSPCALISLTSSEHALYPSLRCSSMVKGASEQVCLLCCSAGSQELCRLTEFFFGELLLPLPRTASAILFLKFHNLLCPLLLASHCFLLRCSVFKVQTFRPLSRPDGNTQSA